MKNPEPNHELNLSRIQSGDFKIESNHRDGVKPVLWFEDQAAGIVWLYYLTIQSKSWSSAGGQWPKNETYHISREDEFVFTLEGFKKALEENKNRLIISNGGDFSVPLTPQEVYKIHQRIETYQKNIAEREAKASVERTAAAKRHEEYLKEYNEKMDNLRQQRCQAHAM
jgi:hypothetical protein